jgi:methionyl-tRNA formyltransferase
LTDKLSFVGAELLVKTLPLYLEGKITPQEQNHELATFTELLKKEDGKLDLSQPAEKLARQIRSVLPWPGAKMEITLKNKVVKLKVLQAEAITLENNKKTASSWLVENNQLIIVCSNNSGLNLKLVQPLGKNPQSARDFINGYLK